jgi:predicted nucleic acid-binding protein
VPSLLELLQGAQNKHQQRLGQNFLLDLNFRVLPLTELEHRALIYIEQPSSGLRASDAIVAATAVESGLALASANRKRFTKIEALDLVVFRS